MRRLTNSTLAGYRDLEFNIPRAFIRIPHKAYTLRNKRLLISARMNERDQREGERERFPSFVLLLLLLADTMADEWKKGRVVIRSASTKTSNNEHRAIVISDKGNWFAYNKQHDTRDESIDEPPLSTRVIVRARHLPPPWFINNVASCWNKIRSGNKKDGGKHSLKPFDIYLKSPVFLVGTFCACISRQEIDRFEITWRYNR